MHRRITQLLVGILSVLPLLLSAQQAYKITYQKEFTLEGIKELPIPVGPGGYESIDRRMDNSILYQSGDRAVARYGHPVVDARVANGRILRDTSWESFVVKDLVSRKAIVKRMSGGCHYLELASPEDWKISNDVKSINGILAQRAVQTSGLGTGKIAWFYPASPVRGGPWSSTGLPGLIVDLLLDNVHYFLLDIEEISQAEFEHVFNNTNDCEKVVTREEYINSVMGN